MREYILYRRPFERALRHNKNRKYFEIPNGSYQKIEPCQGKQAQIVT